MGVGTAAGRARGGGGLGVSCGFGLVFGLGRDLLEADTMEEMRSDGFDFSASLPFVEGAGIARRAGAWMIRFLGGDGRSSMSESSSSDTTVDFTTLEGLAFAPLLIPSSGLVSSSDTNLGKTVPGL